MSLWRQLTRGMRVLTRREHADADLDDELTHFFEEATEAHLARGLSPDEARRAARREVGSPIAVREQVRDHGWEHAVATFLTDLRFAGRLLRRSPIFSVVIVFVIALGSGAVTTIFSAMNAVILRPLPGVADIDRLVTLRLARRDGSEAEQGSFAFYSYLRDRTRSLDGIAAWGRATLTISAQGQSTIVYANLVSGRYFDVLGVKPALGRFFVEDEDRTPRTHPVLVVSHAFWITHLNSSPQAIGSQVLVNGQPFTLIGVAAPAFRGIYTGIQTDAWAPLMMQPVLRPRTDLRNASWLWLSGRLAPGLDRSAARAELSALTDARFVESGQTESPRSVRAMSVTALTGLPGGESTPLFGFFGVLLGAASLVLLIAGVNVAALLSARYTARLREMAVRAALGAGRGRLLRQLLTEVLLLFTLGAVGGFAAATAATAALERLPLPANLPITLELSPDVRVLAFTLVTSLIAGLTFGLAPALGVARKDITSRLRADSAGAGRQRSVFSRGLIVAQIAFSLVLLVAAGLFVRALGRGQDVDPGFDVSNVVTATFDSESWGYDEARARTFFGTLRDRMTALGTVVDVSYAGRLPLMAGTSTENIDVNGVELPVNYTTVDRGYFAVLGLPMVAGRAFTSTDIRTSPRVAVVNQTLARRLAADGEVIGRTFRFRDTPTTIVGVARDAKYATLDETMPSFAYFPIAQVWHAAPSLLVKTAGGTEQFANDLRQAVVSIDPNLPAPRAVTLQQVTSIVLLPQRAGAIVTAALGAIGLLLATAGLYGVLAFSAGRRTREIGIRVALGSARSDVLRMMVNEGLWLGGLGIASGIVLAAATTRLMRGWLFGVSPLDTGTFAAMAAVFAVVAAIASYLPARLAAGRDPVSALRGD
jgi:predicted permease